MDLCVELNLSLIKWNDGNKQQILNPSKKISVNFTKQEHAEEVKSASWLFLELLNQFSGLRKHLSVIFPELGQFGMKKSSNVFKCQIRKANF